MFMAGSGRDIVFTAYARVVAMAEPEFSSRENDGDPRKWALKISVSDYTVLEDRRLDDLVYSLSLVLYLRSPGRNIRHGVRLPAWDAETIVTGRLHARRTAYFGILEHLPETWREVADLYCRSQRMRRSAEMGRVHEGASDSTAWEELVDLLQTDAILPARLGAELAVMHRELFGADQPAPILDDDPDTRREPAWNLTPIFRFSLPRISEVSELLSAVVSGVSDSQQGFGEIEWQPVRW